MQREQFISLVERSQKNFRRFLTALCCGDTALADDIAQESYIKAYLNIQSLNDNSRFNQWLFRIGYNTFVSSRRSARQTDNYDKAIRVAAAQEADDAFRYQELYAALDAISPRERSAILLFYMQGYSIKEICDIINASQAAVKQYLSRGRTHLRSILSSPQK